MTLALGSRPKQRQGKVQAKNATQESHLHSRECKGMNPHTPKWTPTLGGGVPHIIENLSMKATILLQTSPQCKVYKRSYGLLKC
jgi:hypothetical protein